MEQARNWEDCGEPATHVLASLGMAYCEKHAALVPVPGRLITRIAPNHRMTSRAAMLPPEPKMEAFLSDLAAKGKVAVSTQNQAFNALVLLYRQVLKLPLEHQIHSVRAERKINLPLVLTREEGVKVIALVAV
jgi:hypothetical protein